MLCFIITQALQNGKAFRYLMSVPYTASATWSPRNAEVDIAAFLITNKRDH